MTGLKDTRNKVTIEKMERANKKFRLMLRAAYQYYWLDNPEMSDSQYDALTREVSSLEKDIRGEESKKLVDFTGLKTSSSLHYIPEDAYPTYARFVYFSQHKK